MQANKEIMALLHLVDDPDSEVFDTVADRLLHYGREIIPNLEQLWEVTEDESVQYRIEHLIHRALFTELQQEFAIWGREPMPSLFKGAMLIAKYRYPELNIQHLMKQLDQMRRNIWLELNAYLTPLEQINVVNSILYNYYKLNGHEITERDSNLFFINHTLESKQGNAFSIGIIYLALCELLDIPIFAVGLPRQFVIAYFDTQYHFLTPDTDPLQTIQFYIDPVNGMVYTQNDVEVYLKKIKAGHDEKYFQPLSNKEVVIRMLEEMALTYDYANEGDKSKEMYQLISVLKNDPS
jgi:regulator of sirC expression with transglutaminase-like and TPR domain